MLDPRWFLPYNIGSFQGLGYVRWLGSEGRIGEDLGFLAWDQGAGTGQ